jgi:adenosine deaminase
MDPIKDWYEKVPKIELHVHLEGSIPYDALWELICKYGNDLKFKSIEDLKAKFEYKDFSQFINTWVWKNNYLREYEDFTYIAEAVACDMAHQNIRYAEVFFSPPDFFRHGLTTQKLAESIRKGFSKVSNITIALIPDLVRDFGPQLAAFSLEEVVEAKDFGIIGIGLGGSEQSFPPDPFGPIYERARELGLHTTVHAGEASGAKSIWEAIKFLKPDRLGHGTRAVEDENLIDYLAKQKIPVEVCPISNVCTGIVRSIKSHPIRRFYDCGLSVSVNTDDPKMFGNSLAKEYRTLVDELGFSKDDVRFLIIQGIRSSWMLEKQKDFLSQNFISDPAWKDGE